MERRKFLIGMGSVAAGGAAAMGTGAFTSLSADRDIAIALADDNAAMIGITEAASDNSASYFSQENGQAVLDFDGEVDASGFNDGVTWVDDVFKLTNNSNQKQYIWIVEDGVRGRDKAVGFYVGTGPSDGSDPEYQVSVGSNDIKPRDLQPLKPYDNTVVPDEGTHAMPLPVGHAETVGLVVDTRQLGNNPSPGNLLNKITINAVADTDDLPARDNGAVDLKPPMQS